MVNLRVGHSAAVAAQEVSTGPPGAAVAGPPPWTRDVRVRVTGEREWRFQIVLTLQRTRLTLAHDVGPRHEPRLSPPCNTVAVPRAMTLQ